jgi:ATP-binding cassette subfamily B protein
MPYVFIWLIIRELFGENNYSKINTYSLYAVLSAVLGIAIYFLALSLSHLAAFRAEVEIRRKSMKTILQMPLGFLDKNTSGKIRKIIDENAGITHSFLAHQMPDLAGTIITPIFIIASLFIFDWKLGITCLIPVFFALLLMKMMMGKKGQHFMKLYMDSLEDMNTEAVEYVRGIPVVKVFQQTVYSFKNFHKSIKKYKNYVIEYTHMWENPMSTYIVIINSFVFFLVPIGIILINNNGNKGYIMLNIIFYVLTTPLMGRCIMRSMYLNQALWQADEAIKRIESLNDFEGLEKSEVIKSSSLCDVEFKNVVFKYPGALQNAVDNVSFKIKEGETYALVGPSGSGKSTIAKLLPRFWDVSQGEIKIGGVNIKDYDPKVLMDKISFVFQNTKLFKGSIMENIRYGNPKANYKDIDKAIDMAQCREIIDKLPMGLDTIIGTHGVYLSGGEQQRIALARAILKNAPIVVLDEATAFADPENEYLIQKALHKLTEGKTVLMIAHRLASVKNVDCILLVDKGKITEKGKHSDLLDERGTYEAMWKEYNEAVHWQIGEVI